MSTLLETCQEILRDPVAYGRGLRKGGRRVVGTLCSYAPEELIVAAGAVPFRLFGSGRDPHRADAHLQSYCCSLVRGVLAGGLSGELDFLDGIVFPHTCDSIQRLSDLWRMNLPGPFHLDVVLPVKLDSASARAYLADVLAKFRRELGQQLGVEIGDADLAKAVQLLNRSRGSLAALYRLNCAHPGTIRGGELHAIVKASQLMDRDQLCELLPAFVEERSKQQPSARAATAKRILLAGGLCNQPDLYRLIEEAGGVVVEDDLCTGARSFAQLANEAREPLAALAERIATRPPCPAKHAGLKTRADHLVRLAREHRVAGVIFLQLKFCDPHAFDHPHLKAALDRAGLPSLLLELEAELPAEGQLRTRFETFIEMIS